MSVSLVRNNRERRDPAAREALLRRIRREFEEMPCMPLTCAQAQRLFGMKAEVCERVLGSLVLDGTLYRTDRDGYRLNDSASWPGHHSLPTHLRPARSKAS
jgi:hypothetical protein